jgi:hypothetical protein
MFGTEEPPTSHSDFPVSPDTLRHTILQSRQASSAASATTTPHELPTHLGAMGGSSGNDTTRPTAKSSNTSIVDVRNPLHPKHSEAQALRSKIITALENQTHLDFRTQDLTLTVVHPSTHNRLTLLLQQRNKLESQLEHLLARTPLRLTSNLHMRS